MMADSDPFLFVSHVSEDRAAAMQIVAELERRGVPCWIAPRNVGPGKPFDDEIASALDHCQAMLLIFSDQCNESEYIRREVTVAGENQKLIIPFRIEDAQPRRGLRVRLSDLHWLDGFAAHEGAIDELTRRFAPSAAQEALQQTADAERSRQEDEAKRRQQAAKQQPQAPPVIAPPSKPPAPLAAAVAPAAPAAQPSRPATVAPAPAARLPQPTNSMAGNYRAAIGGVGVLAVAGIAAAAWFWSGDFGAKPAPAPVAAEALSKGKAAFDAKDYVAAMRWDRQAADQGDATAQTYVGYLYETGLGVPQDYAQALSWYRKAADQGHAPAQKNIGNLYEQGSGVTRDYAEAMRWFRLAADQGNPGAQTNIGYMFEQGLGVAQDYPEAMRWYRKAADQGEATAQNNIGVFYDRGYGVAQDYSEAMRWYRLAADQGNIDAEFNLALIYADGHGVAPDLEQARQWMQKAAEAGDPEAKRWLGSHGG
jgi:TPR repeat protein